jgi:tetratricopeptide (TPR) repeat protein
MNPDSQHLNAAHGYADLGLWLDGNAELEQISPDFRDATEVLAIRLRIYRALEKWDLMQVVARQLALRDPDNVSATIEWAFAARRAECIEAARLILNAAVERLPGSALLHYELARCECLLGDVEAAKARLKRAFDLEPELREPALEEPDLEAVW